MQAIDYSQFLDSRAVRQFVPSQTTPDEDIYGCDEGLRFCSEGRRVCWETVRLAEGAFLLASEDFPGEVLSYRQTVNESDWVHIQFRLTGGGSEDIARTGLVETPESSCVVSRYPENSLALRTSAKFFSGLVLDLMDFSAVIRGELRVEPRLAASVMPVIQTVVQAFQPVAKMRDLALTCEAEGPAGPVKTDTLRLQQVMWNLIANAIRHTPSGGHIAVRVATRGTDIEVVVRDSGIGIPADELPHIFERNWRGKAAGCEPDCGHRGLGLGLAIAQRIVELHGGNITAHSEGAGCGTQFLVRLPVSAGGAQIEPGSLRRAEEISPRLQHAVSVAARGTARQVPDGRAKAIEVLEGMPSANRQPRRILLVEDDDGLAGACQRLLSSHGHRVVRARGCAGALAVVSQEPLDLIISDIHLADGDAFALLESIRSLLHRPISAPLPIIAMSALLGEREIAQYRSAGFAAQIGKPFQEQTLLRALKEAMRCGPLTQIM